MIILIIFNLGNCFAKFEKTKDFVSKRVITLLSKYQQVYNGLNDGVTFVSKGHLQEK